MRKIQTKIHVAIIFGGRSAEHDVSIVSAKNVFAAIDRDKYDVSLFAIDKSGQWLVVGERELMSEKAEFAIEKMTNKKTAIPFTKDAAFFIKIGKTDIGIDVVFPVLHGPFGEDGTIQGLLKLFNAPFVGPSVLGSAVGMDKDVCKRLLRDAGIPIAKFLVFNRNKEKEISFAGVKKALGLPLFIKPANLGSSVGISKVRDENEFFAAIKAAFFYDNKIIIEENIIGREIECSILGNDKPIASILGEIVPGHDFYSYEVKYFEGKGVVMSMPAKMAKPLSEKIRSMAIKVFETLCCEGMGRVDFFLTQDNKIIVNEINTIPGFTKMSMYPKLLEKTGISYSELIDRLIKLAIERNKKENRLKISR